MELFLVRHGEAAASWGEAPDPGLSELGQQQAEAAAKLLGQHIGNDTLLISSPLQRALETAEPLAGLLQQPVCEEAVFREIPSPVPLAQRQGVLPRVSSGPAGCLPGLVPQAEHGDVQPVCVPSTLHPLGDVVRGCGDVVVRVGRPEP